MIEIRTRARTVALFAVLAAPTSAPLMAVDGVIEINQARALAGGVTPGDGTGFPVIISASGSYRLTGNLTVGKDDIAIEVVSGAAEATIDLNGFAILGPVLCSPTCSPADGLGVGIYVHAPSRVRILQGAIHGMGSYGMWVESTATALIQSLHVEHVRYGGIVASGVATLEDVIVEHSGGNGISVGAAAVIRGCSALQNGGWGIIAGNGSVIAQSTAKSNTVGGIVTTESASVVGNTAVANGVGIEVGTGAAVLDNVVSGNGTGLFFDGTGGFARNVLTGNNGGDANAQVDGPGIQIGTNICGNRVSCP